MGRARHCLWCSTDQLPAFPFTSKYSRRSSAPVQALLPSVAVVNVDICDTPTDLVLPSRKPEIPARYCEFSSQLRGKPVGGIGQIIVIYYNKYSLEVRLAVYTIKGTWYPPRVWSSDSAGLSWGQMRIMFRLCCDADRAC